MNVDDIVAAKVEAARRRIEAAKRRRTALAAARQRGLAVRHAAKLRNLRSRDGNADVGQQPTTEGLCPTVPHETEPPQSKETQ